MIYDISRPLSTALVTWPGDTPYNFRLGTKISEGSSCNIGALNFSCHYGTHMDAPYHYLEDGLKVDELSLEYFIGPAAIVEASGAEVVTTDYFDNIDFSAVSRVLIRTDAWRNNSIFPARFGILADDVPDFLGRHGVKLIGVDVPSVDRADNKEMHVHHLIARNKILIVESLDLTGVPPGTYEFIGLPLKIVGGDGCPIRAILRDLPVTIPAGNRRIGQ